MRIFKIDGDPKRIWVRAGYQLEDGGWYESDDVELSNNILAALKERNYRVVPLGSTTPTEYFTAEQLETLYSEFYVEKTVVEEHKETTEEELDRRAKEIEEEVRKQTEGMSFEEIMALLQAEDAEAMRSDMKNSENHDNPDDPDNHNNPHEPDDRDNSNNYDNHDEPASESVPESVPEPEPEEP